MATKRMKKKMMKMKMTTRRTNERNESLEDYEYDGARKGE